MRIFTISPSFCPRCWKSTKLALAGEHDPRSGHEGQVFLSGLDVASRLEHPRTETEHKFTSGGLKHSSAAVRRLCIPQGFLDSAFLNSRTSASYNVSPCRDPKLRPTSSKRLIVLRH